MFLSEQDKKDLKALKNWALKHKKEIAIGTGIVLVVKNRRDVKKLNFAVKELSAAVNDMITVGEIYGKNLDGISVELDDLHISNEILFGRTMDLAAFVKHMAADKPLFEQYFGNKIPSLSQIPSLKS